MSEPTLTLDYDALASLAGYHWGYGKTAGSWSSAQAANVALAVEGGLRRFYGEREWTFLMPVTSMTIWPDILIALDRSGAVATGVYDGSTYTVITSDTAEFTSDMVGKLICVDATGAWEIAAFVSSTVVKIAGNHAFASKEYSVATNACTVSTDGTTDTITATAASFYPSMVGKEITITDVGTLTINGYTSSTVVTALGNDTQATAESFSLEHDGSFRLPDDCGVVHDPLTLPVGEGFGEINLISESQIRHERQYHDYAGIPRFAAQRPLAHDPTVGQRYELLIYPNPDQTWVLTFQYTALQNKIDGTNKYPLGGMEHAETIKYAILAEVEAMKHMRGQHTARYQEELVKSVRKDMQKGAEYMGSVPGGARGHAFGDTTRHRAIHVAYNGQRYPIG